MKIERTKEWVVRMINRLCHNSDCKKCFKGEEYGNYENCPYINFKQQIAGVRKVNVNDIPDELAKIFDAEIKSRKENRK